MKIVIHLLQPALITNYSNGFVVCTNNSWDKDFIATMNFGFVILPKELNVNVIWLEFYHTLKVLESLAVGFVFSG